MRTITRALLGWLFPPTGQRRAEEPPAEPTDPVRRTLITTNRAVPVEIIDGDTSPLVRPYVIAHEQFAPETLGQDSGTIYVHGGAS
ncbi:hypothetical protein [Streptomyces megasporus]|uniref:hypothetical protein n=1 Tax=Streptomyces megasporus TaxID=44060 RepID=UPI0012FEC069|nr:hypothetical protein [Streptomyces megasporus]